VTDRDPSEATHAKGKVAPETLELRARAQPVTRISRKVLIGGAAIVLVFISGIVLVALKPPSLRIGNPQELFNVEHKPITDGLNKLPATYDGVKSDKKVDTGKSPVTIAPGIPKLTAVTDDPIDQAERAEKARLARMAGQARESQVFFRLQLKTPPRDTVSAEVRPEAIPRPTPKAAEGDLTAIAALRAAERARALAAGDVDLLANDTTEQTRKLSFLKAGPEKEIYNPHGLQKPVSPYQLMAGTIIAASLVSGLNSDLPALSSRK
jgi:type IV secretion system protein VirB10